MYKRYFIKKDPNCRKKDIEWIELSGREFYRFVNDPANKDRHFVDMMMWFWRAHPRRRENTDPR